MDSSDIYNYLYNLTDNEKLHIQNPNKLSDRYKEIPTTNDNNYYIFRFEKLLEKSNICIKKFSRFTNIPPHIHTVIELNYVYKGKCEQIINGVHIILNEGDVIILDTNTPHEITPLSQDDIVIQIDMRKEYFSSSFLTRLSSEGILSNFLANSITEAASHNQYILFKCHNDNNLRLQMEQLMCEYFDKNRRSNEIIDSCMIIIFSFLLRIYKSNKYFRYEKSEDVSRLINILQYIEQNYMDITLEKLASDFGLHPNYLTRYIKQHTGKTFKDLVISQKMHLVSFQLINTDVPIYRIANEIGYENIGFFYKKFKEYYKLNPNEYRSKYSNIT